METDPGSKEPAPGQPQPGHRPVASPGRRTLVLIGIAVVAAVLIAAAFLPALLAKPPGEVPYPTTGTATPTRGVTLPVPTTPGVTLSMTPARTVPSTVRTTVQGTTPTPVETGFPAVTGTTQATQTCIPNGEPGFTVQVSPVKATAAQGETVTYHMTIQAQNCFTEQIHMELVASILFLSQTYDLGTQDPPYPKTFEYPFQVPGTIPPGVTVNGVIRSTGGGITRENQVSLTVR